MKREEKGERASEGENERDKESRGKRDEKEA
jgi:hypothetical protein